ncbi:hypothetical protein HSX10_17530 [Winogradskyella undariae]|uniref:hypothetical protein n=1 Tax=Winogradskyella undariae TaxID=1285465 RepID=UPI00156B1D27|nr:hypothetical protein [Winogradskyella undariae]NRR93379.1 hypothetical protein [Winogradskyella undariae]
MKYKIKNNNLKYIVKLTILIPLILFSSCAENIDKDTINNFDDYQKAKDILVQNIKEIKENVDYQLVNENLNQENQNVFFSNEFHFKNTVAQKNKELLKVLDLWTDGRISADKVFGTISLSNDSTVIFKTKYNGGIFSGISHYLIYDPQNRIGLKTDKNSEILKVEEIKKNWKYVIEKRFYVD